MTWAGLACVALVSDVYAGCIVNWRVSGTARASLVLDALKIHRGELAHYSDRRSKYVSCKHTERRAEKGIEPSVGSVGNSYGNVLIETITVFTEPRSSTGEVRGVRLSPWNTPR